LLTIQEKDKLSKDVSDIIFDYENKIYISSESIKEIHKDPFDHAIMAHAITNKITLISSDTQMQGYINSVQGHR